MTSDSGLASQDTDYTRDIQAVLDELQQMQQTPRLVTSPDELEGGRAEKTEEGKPGTAEGEADDCPPPEEAGGDDHDHHIGDADDDSHWQDDIGEKHTEGQPDTQGQSCPPWRVTLCHTASSTPPSPLRQGPCSP